ncbi:MAG: hypothetical protein IPP28_11550 [Xanthomonadales bacterium]|nr:hypothetical protein [Xanthomonadales bacterium]
MSEKRASYTSVGNPKAVGVEVSFDYPASWGGADGKRPNTLYQVTSEGGRGFELCNLVIKGIPVGTTVTPQDVDELFDPLGLRDFTPDGGKFISGAKTTIDGQPAAWVNFFHEIDTAGIRIRSIEITYITYFDNKLIFFSCSVGESARKPVEELQVWYKAYFPLFQQMANSIVIHSKWKHQQ